MVLSASTPTSEILKPEPQALQGVQWPRRQKPCLAGLGHTLALHVLPFNSRFDQDCTNHTLNPKP